MVKHVRVNRARQSVCLGLLVAFFVATAPSPVWAQDAREARALFQQGMEHANSERWVAALESFRASLELVDRPSTRLNIASVLLRLGRHLEARSLLTEFLEAEPSASDRHQADSMLERARAGIWQVEIQLEPPSAELLVDGQVHAETGATRTLELDPGPHDIEVRAEGYAAERRRVEPGTAQADVRLLALPAEVEVRSSVASASIEVDGQERGQGDARIQLTAGRHQVIVRADDHEPFEQWLNLSAGQRLELVASLSPRESDPILESPWLWISVGAAVLLGIGLAVGIGVARGDGEYDGGSLDFVLQPR